MKTVILDGYTLNPGDLSWERFSEIGEYKVYNWTEQNEIVERAKDAQIVIVNKVPITEHTISKLPNLKYIGVIATGYDVVDIKAAQKRVIPVTNVPLYANYSVSQLVFGLVLELCYHIRRHSDSVKKDKKWSSGKYNSYWENSLTELAFKTMGIIGMGKIGQRTAHVAEGFGMKVLGYDVVRNANTDIKNFKWADLDELLEKSDIVSIHCPLFPDTRGMMNKEAFKKMKNTAFFVNTSRGELMVEKDLAWALKNGEIAGAGLDVLENEPPFPDNPLFNIDNCIITPHIGWATIEARKRLMNMAVDNIKAFLDGKPVNVVNNLGKGE